MAAEGPVIRLQGLRIAPADIGVLRADGRLLVVEDICAVG
jgi:hypothetical protein